MLQSGELAPEEFKLKLCHEDGLVLTSAIL
jgi:hypothetical protein